jgi:hypothetical protein
MGGDLFAMVYDAGRDACTGSTPAVVSRRSARRHGLAAMPSTGIQRNGARRGGGVGRCTGVSRLPLAEVLALAVPVC